MNFQWDEAKNRLNRKKHGIWFEEAQTVFVDEKARVFYDEDHSHHEERYIIVGTSAVSRLLVVVHCFRQSKNTVRIISARKATSKEKMAYEERI